MNDTQKRLAFARRFALEAGAIMHRYFVDGDMGVEAKPDKSLVTKADKEINQLLIDQIAVEFPDDGVWGEELSAMTPEDTRLWVCDPVDGTSAFVFGLPTAMFSLAYVEDGVPLIGVAYDPFMKKLFVATKNGQATCNDKPIKVSHVPLDASFVAGPSYMTTLFETEAIYSSLAAKGATIPMFPGGVYKGVLIAEGRLHGRIYSGPWSHDIAAIKVIIEAAGGKVTDLEGNEQRYDKKIKGAILSNGTIHDELVRAVKDFGGAEKVMVSK